MSILFYGPNHDERCNRFRDEVRRTVSGKELEIYDTPSGLHQRLRQPQFGLIAGMLCAPSKNTLAELVSRRSLLDRLPFILLLPDHGLDTISEGHRLHPRFLSYIDDDPDWPMAVLRKMISNKKGPRNG